MKTFDVLIRDARVVFPDAVSVASIAISDGKIVEIGSVSGSAAEEIVADGLHVFPGLIDPHVHFNEPGRTEWEGIATGSAAFAAGGGSCFFDMPLNSSPPTLDGPSFDLKRMAAENSSHTDFALWGGLTPGNLDQLEVLADRGVIGFKAFMSDSGISDFERADDLTLYRGMKIAARLDLIVAVHAESQEMTSRLTAEARGGVPTWDAYLGSRPIVAEVEAIQRAITLAAEAGCRLHIVHVSNSRGAEMVYRAATQSIADVTCETCPHYLELTDADVPRLGALAKCAPPLRSADAVEDLWQAVAAGKFALIGSDHSPSPESMKTGDDPFATWGGIAGVQSTLPILLSHEPALPLTQIAAITASGAAKRFRIAGKGRIALGYDADLVLVDLAATYQLTRDMLLDRHKLSPYVGRSFRGSLRRTLVRGQTVILNGNAVGHFRGRLIKPSSRGGVVMDEMIVRGPLLIPADDGSITYHADGALWIDARGVLAFAGPFQKLRSDCPARAANGIMLPPLLDVHTHVPQHPIRGRFVEGVAAVAPGGRLLAGLQRNVFPAEARCASEEYSERVVREFLADTLSHGVVGGAAYMTVSAAATEIALSILPESWSVGLVLMNQNCPHDLRTDEATLQSDIDRLATKFGRRLIVTDRFAVAVNTPLRRRAVSMAKRSGLRTQTHLNEQVGEKALVESVLYPDAANYTDVYRKDGLLNHECILAHCIQMTTDEWQMISDSDSVIAHCPSSNALLESGRMNLGEVIARNIPYAIATDVGASPTCSMLAEMRRFVQVHNGYCSRATPTEALYRSTLAPARILALSGIIGQMAQGQPASFIEVEPVGWPATASVDDIISSLFPVDPDHPTSTVNRVTLGGKIVFERSAVHA